MKLAKILGVGLIGTITALSSIASADPPKNKGDVEYVFPDADKLTADGFGPNGTTVNVMKFANRQRLLRPRASFVQEMLKSVENM